jgi:hypothetical protein
MVEQVETPAAAGRGVGPRDIARKALSLPGAEPWALELARHVGWEAVLELFHQRRRSLLDGVTDRSVTWLHRSHARFLDDVSSGGEDRGRLTVARLTEPLADALRLAQLRSLVVPLPFEPVAATRAPSPTSEAERTLAVLRTALTPETVRLVPSNVSQSPQITTFPLDEFGPFALIVDLPAPPGSRPEPAPSAEVRREFLVARPSAVVWLSNDGFQKALESRLLPVGQTVSKSRKIRRAFSFREAFASPSPPAGDGPVAIWAAPDDAKSLAPLYGDRALVRSTAAQFREDAPRAGVLHLDLPAELPPNGSPFEARLVFPDGGLSALELLALDLRKVRAAVLAREAPEGILRALLLKGCPAVAVPHGAGGAATRAAHLRALHEALAAGASLEEAYDRTRAAESFALYVGVGSGGG